MPNTDTAAKDVLPVMSSEDALAIVREVFPDGAEFHDVTEYIGRKEEQDSLVNVPFIVTDFHFSDSGYSGGGVYSVVKGIRLDTREPIIFSDGGVGITPVLQEYQEKTGKRAGLFCSRGLRRSDYVNDAGIQGTTYYFG